MPVSEGRPGWRSRQAVDTALGGRGRKCKMEAAPKAEDQVHRHLQSGGDPGHQNGLGVGFATPRADSL